MVERQRHLAVGTRAELLRDLEAMLDIPLGGVRVCTSEWVST